MHPPTTEPGDVRPIRTAGGVAGSDRPSGALRDTAITLVRSAAAALVSVVLPLVMTRALRADRYATWTIALQAFSYGAFLEAGVTLAVSRATAARAARADAAPAIALTAGHRVAALPISLAFVAYGALVALTPWIYPGIPDALRSEARLAIAVMALASLASLASLPAQGFLFGAGRFVTAVVPVAVGTAVAAVAAVIAATAGARIAVVASVFALTRIAASTVVVGQARRHAKVLRSRSPSEEPLTTVVGEIRATVGTMWIWSFAGFLGSGLDLTIVSWADYPMVRAYAVGAALTAALTGVAGAIVTVIVPRVAGRSAAAPESTTTHDRDLRLAGWAIAVVALPLVASADALSERLGGRTDITLVLLAGAWLRSSMTPYVAAMVGRGDHRVLRGSPLLEGMANVALGVLLAPTVGAIGVAVATLVSGAFGVAMHLFRNIPRSSIRHIRARSVLLGATIPSAIALAGAGLVGTTARGAVASIAVTVAVTVGGAAALLWVVATPEDRAWAKRTGARSRRRPDTPAGPNGPVA